MSGWTGRNLANRQAVEKAIAELARHDRAGTSALQRAVRMADEAELAPDRSRLLPASADLFPILPWPGGILRGATVAAVGFTSLLLALLAGAMSEGSWAAVAGVPSSVH
jgi:hypothetical protein